LRRCEKRGASKKMRKILISLAIIGIVSGITLGITGAWWSDQGVSNNQSFVSGNLNLRLSNDGSSWGDNVSNTWNVSKMAPGGTPYESTLYMKNIGSVNADYLKFTLKNYPNPAGMDRVMRITKLEYAGKNLLTGGAGADLSSYVAPTTCDITVHPGTYSKITDAIAHAKSGDVICVGPGDYSTNWEGGVINVTKGVTIASTDGPGNTTISAGIAINANGVTVKGFKIIPANPCAGGGTEGICLGSNGTNTNIQYNEIDGTGFSGQVIGIETVSGGNYTSTLIQHNVIHDLTTGIYTNPHTGTIDIKYNTIYNTVAGVGGFTDATVEFNEFHDNAEAIGADSTYQNAVLQYNNFLGDYVKNYGVSGTLNAENNWWGDFDPSDQVTGNVDYLPYAGGPFIGFINGQDSYANGFADLEDFERSTIVVENPDLLPDSGSYHTLKMGVQLDGPTTPNTYQGGTLGMDMTVIMGQGPAN